MALFQIQKAKNDEFYFILRATGNNETILKSEMYRTKSGCSNGITSVKNNVPLDNRYDRLTAKNGQYYFNLKAANGEVIGTSELYNTTASRDHGIDLVKAQAPTAGTEDLT